MVAARRPPRHRVTASPRASHRKEDGKAGRQRSVWIDQAGAFTTKPETTESAAAQSVLAGLSAASVIILVWRPMVTSVKKVADKHRLNA